MTYIATKWTTTAVARIKADYLAVFLKPDGTHGCHEANLLLTQINETDGARRTVLGVVDPHTCEVIAAPSVPDFACLMLTAQWKLGIRP